MWWPAVVKSECTQTWVRPVTTCVCKPEAANTKLLMMSGMSLEICWAFIERWNNKFYYKVASCWLFLLDFIKLCLPFLEYKFSPALPSAKICYVYSNPVFPFCGTYLKHFMTSTPFSGNMVTPLEMIKTLVLVVTWTSWRLIAQRRWRVIASVKVFLSFLCVVKGFVPFQFADSKCECLCRDDNARDRKILCY